MIFKPFETASSREDLPEEAVPNPKSHASNSGGSGSGGGDLLPQRTGSQERLRAESRTATIVPSPGSDARKVLPLP